MLLTPQPASGSTTQSNSRELRSSAANADRSLTAEARIAPDAMSAPLDIRIDMGLPLAAGMSDGPLLRIPHGLSIAPEGARLIVMAPRLPGLAALGELAIAEVDGERPLLGVEADDVAIPDQADRPAHRRLRPDMADAEAAGGAGEATVGDEGDLVAHALAVDRRRGRQHLAHAGAAARAFVADDQHLAFLVVVIAHRREGVFLGIEAAGGAAEGQAVHAGDLHDRALGRQIAGQADDAAGGRDRLVGAADH